MARYTREQIINMGLDQNAKVGDINFTLKKYGHKPDYNPILEKELWKRLPGNALNNAKGIARDFRTLGGYIARPIVDAEYAYHNAKQGEKLEATKRAFMNAVNNDRYRKTLGNTILGGAIGTFIPKVGPIGGALTGASLGVAGGPKQLADAILSTYNTSTSNLKNTDIKDVAQGIMLHPLYAGLDASIIGTKPLVRGVEGALEHAPTFVKQVFPDRKMREFNRQITNSMLNARTKGDKNYSGYLNLETMPHINRENLVKNIITNETSDMNNAEKLLAETIKTNLRDAEREFVSRGYGDATEFRDNARAQYVMYKMPEFDGLVHDDIYNIIRGEELRTGNPLPSETKINKIKSLAKEGGKLYDENKISWLSQKLAPIVDETGNVVAREIVGNTNNYFDTNRIIGKQSTKKLANVFDRTIKEQVDQLSNFINVEDTISDLVKNFEMEPISILGKNQKLPEGKTAFSVNAFKDYIKKHGANTELGDALKASRVAQEGAYILDNMYLNMINNAFKKTTPSGSRRLLNSFKKAVLANPHWIVLNRLGNWSNNFMDGVTLLDYMDAKAAHKLGIIPKELEHQTSFGSYVNSLEGAENIQGISSVTRGIGKSSAQPISRIKQAYGKFSNSKKKLEDISELSAQLLANSSDITANPFYKIEAALEYADRSANIVSQAKRYGAKHNLNWKEVLRKASEDSKLFHELNTGVNKALGDYIGRNYAMPKGIYETLGFAVPFYRFLTQTGRTTAHQLAHNPIGFMSNVTIPSRAGYNLSREYQEKYGLDINDYNGGVPYFEENGNIRTIGFEPLPAANVMETFANMRKGTELRNILSPYITTFPDIVSFKKYGKTASSPRRIAMMLNGGYTDAQGDKYEPTLGEVLSYGANTLANTLYHPYRLTSSQGRELVASALGKGIQSQYDTTPLGENPLSYKRTLPVELVGKWFGLQTRSNYKSKNSAYKKNLNKSMSKKLAKQVKYNKNKK